MKLFLLLFLAGCAVRCDDNNYYVIEMPEEGEAARAHRPLTVYWNVPTMQCTSKKIPFKNLERFGIIQNTNDSFRGEKISILYDPGIFPALLYNQSSKELRYRNGGVPQEGDLQLHLKMFSIVLDQSIPDKSFSGIGIIDFESWRPILRQNFGDVYPYKSISYEIERKEHWLWPQSWIKEEATHRFETAARIFMQNTIALAKKMRPKARWGYYGFPYCFNMANNNPAENCTSDVKDENDQIDWLWMESTALYPSVYSSYRVGGAALSQLIRGRVREAARVRRKGPLLPYFWFRYRDGGFFDENDLHIALKTFNQSEADGFIIWGSSNDVNTPEKCTSLLKYIENVMGPAVKRYTKPDDISNHIVGEPATDRGETTKEINHLSNSRNVTRIHNNQNYKDKSNLTNAPKYFKHDLNIHTPAQNVTDSTVHVGNDSLPVYEDYDTTAETLSDKANVTFKIGMLALTTTISTVELSQSTSAMPESTTIINKRHNSNDDLFELKSNNADNILELASNIAYGMLQSAPTADEQTQSANNISKLETTTAIYDMYALASTSIIDARNNSSDMPEHKTFTTFDDFNNSTDYIYEFGPNITADKLNNTSDEVMLESVITIPPFEFNNSTDGLIQEIATNVTLDEVNNSTDNAILEKSNSSDELEYDDHIDHNLDEYLVLDENDDETEKPNLIINLSIKQIYSGETTIRAKTTPPPQMVKNSKMNEQILPLNEPPIHITTSTYKSISIWEDLGTKESSNITFAESLEKIINNYSDSGEFTSTPTSEGVKTEKPSYQTVSESLENITKSNEANFSHINFTELLNDSGGIAELKDLISENDTFDELIKEDNTLEILKSALKVNNLPTTYLNSSEDVIKDELDVKNTTDIIRILNIIDLLQKTKNKKQKLATPNKDFIDKRKPQNETAVLRNRYISIFNKTTPVSLSIVEKILLSRLKAISSIQYRKFNQSETLADINQQNKEEKITAQDTTNLEEKLGSLNEKKLTYKNAYEISANIGHEEASTEERDNEDDQDNTASDASSDQVLIVWL